MKVAEDAALRGEAVKVGSDEAFCTEDADIGVALIVGEDDDDVGKGGMGGGKALRVGERESEEESKNGKGQKGHKGPKRVKGVGGWLSGVLHTDIADGFWRINQELGDSGEKFTFCLQFLYRNGVVKFQERVE
jgi:hypothetical protein